MGSTHFRSDVREKGARTASFSTIAAGALTCDSLVNAGTVTQTGLSTNTGGVSVPATSYIKLGAVYVICPPAVSLSGAAGVFSNATLNAAASTALTGVVATKGDIPRGSLLLNASVGNTASTLIFIKVGLASWASSKGDIMQT